MMGVPGLKSTQLDKEMIVEIGLRDTHANAAFLKELDPIMEKSLKWINVHGELSRQLFERQTVTIQDCFIQSHTNQR